MTVAFFTALALVVSPAHAAGENWVLVSATSQGSQIFVDHAALRRTGDLVVVSEKRDNSRNAESEYLDIRMQSAYNCAAGTFQIRSATATLKSGAAPVSVDKGTTVPFAPVGEGTVAAAILKHVCAATAN